MGVAQFVADLLLGHVGAEVEHRIDRAVGVRERIVAHLAPAEHVGEAAPAFPHAAVRFSDDVLPVDVGKARLVNGDVEATEALAVLVRGAVCICPPALVN